MSYTGFTSQTYCERVLLHSVSHSKIRNHIQTTTPSASLKPSSVMFVANKPGYKFVYSIRQNDRDITRLLAVFVENKKGYVVAYSCDSSLFRFLREVATRMLASFSVTSSEEDLVTNRRGCEA